MIPFALGGTDAHADAGGPVDLGRALSERHCGRCHQIDPAAGIGGIGSTPSFTLLMSLPDAEHRFETFFVRRPHPGFIRMDGVEPLTPLPASAAEIPLTADDLDAILAFARSLKNGAD